MTAAASGPSNEREDGEEFAVRLVREIARALDRDPLDLPPLAREVDLEALSSLVRDGRTAVSFEYEGCEVEIEPSGDVSVAPLGGGGADDGVARSDADAA
ncbi:hypothetical protein C474_12326 [Halogeometricum pallidum JCM 14848]|uniref:Halobacterial output domain-containing protein n=1 Tax=Halogeometricum pallidum JCM 14848 TaxID=1227487 RepID=M0D2Y5_HALPD|nr:HalOD1 output domain-containing protein [Halogeometricum pallidum]ELZ29820.1 hypothetical protein C474_12326 [Halogeometricum pallidum JCM 14848]